MLRAVEPQVFDLLLFLVENHDRVLSRDEIFEQVWRNRIVSDSVLSTRINAVRNAIGDNGLEQRLIRTLHGRGFRFVAPLRANSSLTLGGAAGSGTADVHSANAKFDQTAIAVVPFSCDAAERRHFCDEIAESVMVGLSRVPWLNVIASNLTFSKRLLSMDVRQLGRALGAAYVLQGRLRLLTGGFRVFVELVDAETGRQIWVERYDPERDSVQDLHKKRAAQIVLAVKKHLSQSSVINAWRKQASDLAVWDCILRAI